MRQFQVPQFITIEDKVIGPFTIKQFLYLIAGAAVAGLAYFFFESFISIPVALIAGSLAGSLAFLKINEQPLPAILKHALFYFLRPRLYLWRQQPTKRQVPDAAAPKKSGIPAVEAIPKISRSRLADLAWSLDIQAKTRTQP